MENTNSIVVSIAIIGSTISYYITIIAIILNLFIFLPSILFLLFLYWITKKASKFVVIKITNKPYPKKRYVKKGYLNGQSTPM